MIVMLAPDIMGAIRRVACVAEVNEAGNQHVRQSQQHPTHLLRGEATSSDPVTDATEQCPGPLVPNQPQTFYCISGP